MATTTRLTIEDFEKLPAEAVKHRELVDGELIDVSGNTGEHNAFRDLMISLLLPFATQAKLDGFYQSRNTIFAETPTVPT